MLNLSKTLLKTPLHTYSWLDKTLFWLFIYLFIINDYLKDSSFGESWHWALLELGINMLLVFIHHDFLIPWFFKTKKYLTYTLGIISLLALLTSTLIWSNLGDMLLLTVSLNNIITMQLTALLLIGFSFLYWYYKQWFLKTNEALVLQAQKLETELQFLRNQISPHFLFNTLNNIYSLCQQKHDNAGLMVSKLSHILRYLIYEGANQRVSLIKELNMLENYIQLQLLKKSKSQNIDFYSEGIENQHKIAPLLLINFLENSFKHSNFFNDAEAWIEVSCSVEEDNHFHLIINNSLFLSTESSNKDNGGVGMKNVKRQLELHYPDTHQLGIEKTKESFFINLYIQLDNKTLPQNA